MSFNRVIMVGNLTRDPDYKQLSSGQAVCRLGIASNRQFKNKQNGDMIQEVCYIDIDVWGPQAESCRQYLQKGRPVLIEGRLKFDSWEDATSGQKRSKHSIVADRVVFLSYGAQSEDSSEKNETTQGGLDLNNPAEKELFNQINQIKNRTQARPAAPQQSSYSFDDVRVEPAKVKKKAKLLENIPDSSDTGELNFNDEPPFIDDLPF
ncbi:single-stranded DNA-binding protein [Candidatus Dependentiae bacterium Noda2021]|nr:single-stranded DNA-binding protein [Candidatus Dependentiae bacterium Noda2021]